MILGLFYDILEIIGTVAFAISGAIVATRNKMDILGVIILGTTTSVGGGMLRDVLIGKNPPTALQDPLYALIAIGVSLIVFIPKVRKIINTDHFWLIISDAVGLGTFTVLGLDAASDGNFFMQVFLGVLTGVGGGVLRDLFALEKPMIFVRHFYAAASIIGASVCAIIYPYERKIAMISGLVIIVILRVLAAKFKWHLPKAE